MIYFLCSLIPYLLGNDLSKESGFVLIGLFTLFWLVDAAKNRDMLILSEPSALIVTYTLFSILFGSIGYQYEFVLNERGELSWFASWKYYHVALAFSLFSISILISWSKKDFKYNKLLINSARSIKVKFTNYDLIPLVVLIPFFFIGLDLQIFGGVGDLSILPKTLAAILCFVNIQRAKLLYRFALYSAIIVLFVTFSIHDKREAIFLVFPVLWLEFVRVKYCLSFLGLIALIGATISLLCLILLMSISRGYGGFGEFDSIFQAAPYLPKYVISDKFIGGLLNNIEASSFFFNGMNAINYVIENSVYTFGSTLLKFLFVLVPRAIYPDKPNSMIDIYTTAYDYEYRSIGGSDPINIFAEYFWNFHFFGLIVVIILAFLAMRLSTLMYRSYLKNRCLLLSCGLIAYMNLLTMLRGSGLDQYLVYVLITCIFAFVGYMVQMVFMLLSRRLYVRNSSCNT